jgi:DNA repair exonuclease SbcCD nuclease subunit
LTRILCLADTQIGVGTVELADQRVVLEQIVDLALGHEVELVVHGGDVFEGPVVTPEQMRMFLDATAPLRMRSVPMLILRGNGRHDSAVRSVHALDVLRNIDGFIVSDRPESLVFENVEVCTLPWVHPGALIASMNGSVDHDHVNTAVSDLLVRIARDLRQGRPAVLVAHWAITGAALPSGLPVEEMREPVIPWGELDALGYDAIIGAHIHQPQRLDKADLDKTVGIVLGSPQPLNFGETGARGCWLIDRGVPEFIPIASRQFVTLSLEDLDEGVPEGAYVRVRATLSATEAEQIDQQELRRMVLEQGAHAVRLDVDIERESRKRADITEQVGPEEAMELYCDAAGIEEPLRGQLIETIQEWSHE